MKTWDSPSGSLKLGRFPVDDEDPTLQAWNGADRLIARWLEENLPPVGLLAGLPRGGPARTLLVLNDAWGALSCLGISLGFRVVQVNDSWLSFQACRENLARNGLDSRNLVTVRAGGDQSWMQDLDLLSALAPGADAVLIRMPRNLDLLSWQLAALAELSGTVALECPLVLGGLDKDLVPRARELLDRNFRCHDLSRGDFKAHLAIARAEDALRVGLEGPGRTLETRSPDPGSPASPRGGRSPGPDGPSEAPGSIPPSPAKPIDQITASWPRRIPVPGHDGLDMVNWPGVFSRDGIDQAGLFLLETLGKADLSRWIPPAEEPQTERSAPVSGGLAPLVVDLGCGNGLLSLGLARLHPGFRYLCTDECAAALDSARSGHALLDPGLKPQMEFLWTHSLTGVADHCAALVLCNPPFHTQGGQGLGIAAHMFADAARVLLPGGSLVVVANRHLGHHRNLEAWFKQVEMLANNGNFVVLRGTNR